MKTLLLFLRLPFLLFAAVLALVLTIALDKFGCHAAANWICDRMDEFCSIL